MAKCKKKNSFADYCKHDFDWTKSCRLNLKGKIIEKHRTIYIIGHTVKCQYVICINVAFL